MLRYPKLQGRFFALLITGDSYAVAMQEIVMKKRPVPVRRSIQSATDPVASPQALNPSVSVKSNDVASQVESTVRTKAAQRKLRGQARYFHYTTTEGLRGILRSGEIKPTVWPASDYAPAVSLVWCSTARTWEPCSSAAGVLEAAGVEGIREGAYLAVARIRVKPQGLREWQEHLAACPKMIVNMGLYGMDCGSNPDNWFVASQPIAATDWMGIELWDGSRWQPLEAVSDPEVADLHALQA
jgi:hypothetical protein